MSTRQDRSAASGITITCDDCPHFHAFAWSRIDAEGAEIRHERLVHPTVFRARKRKSNREYAARRRRDTPKSDNIQPPNEKSEVNPESRIRGTLRSTGADA